ncbi:MAG: hypothetical protein ACI4OG_01790, partial [Bacilli bacterium]
LSYTSYMSVDAGFCNDRSTIYTEEAETIYGAYNRLYNTNQPQFACPQTNDLFTMSTSSKGNKALTYPVGLITADEVVYAGIVYDDGETENTNYYLNNSTVYWTMSPIHSASGAPYLFLKYKGLLYRDIPTNVYGARPVINLASYVEITSGDGTIDNPYVVK